MFGVLTSCSNWFGGYTKGFRFNIGSCIVYLSISSNTGMARAVFFSRQFLAILRIQLAEQTSAGRRNKQRFKLYGLDIATNMLHGFRKVKITRKRQNFSN